MSFERLSSHAAQDRRGRKRLARLGRPSVDDASRRPDGMVVVDDFPDQVPVTLAELEAIETWLKPLLDELLGDGSD